MNKTLKLLHVVVTTLLLVSCGGNDKTTDTTKLDHTLIKDNKMIEVLKQKSVIYAKVESFDYFIDGSSGLELLNINQVVISADNITCIADAKLCEEISAFIGTNKLVFSSSEEHSLIEEESPEYRMMQKGTIALNNNTYDATLYYTGKSAEDGTFLKGKLIFGLPAKLLKGELLILEIKGKE